MKRKFRSVVIALVIATTMLFESCADTISTQDESSISWNTTQQEERTTDAIETDTTEETTSTTESQTTLVTTYTETTLEIVTEVATTEQEHTTETTTCTSEQEEQTTTENEEQMTSDVSVTTETESSSKVSSAETMKSTTSTTKTTTKTTSSVSSVSNTTSMTVSTNATTASPDKRVIKDLPSSLQWCIDKYRKDYPNMKIGFGVFSLDGTKGYGYNLDQKINGACTVKAPYELFVLSECQKNKTDIWNETIKYEDRFYNSGSGDIKKSVDYFYKTHDKRYHKFTQAYSIGYLLNLLLTVSDNIAYNMLLSRYPIKEYQKFLNGIGGQQFYGTQTYGVASVRQRLNEWTAILNYINSKQTYSNLLKENLHNTRFCSLVIGMKNKHDYLHKSGWNEGHSYNSACDIAVIDNQYLIIIMTQDDTADSTRNLVVRGMGLAVESYVQQIGGYQNLFKNF